MSFCWNEINSGIKSLSGIFTQFPSHGADPQPGWPLPVGKKKKLKNNYNTVQRLMSPTQQLHTPLTKQDNSCKTK